MRTVIPTKLADPNSAMQGFVTSEPFAIEKAAHVSPKVFLLADQGFSAYSTLIETRRDLVEKRGWISDSDYKEGLTLAQLMPGPLAAQLAMYLGYVHYRIRGATVAGVAFVLPSFLMVVAIGGRTCASVAFHGCRPRFTASAPQ